MKRVQLPPCSLYLREERSKEVVHSKVVAQQVEHRQALEAAGSTPAYWDLFFTLIRIFRTHSSVG